MTKKRTVVLGILAGSSGWSRCFFRLRMTVEFVGWFRPRGSSRRSFRAPPPTCRPVSSSLGSPRPCSPLPSAVCPHPRLQHRARRLLARSVAGKVTWALTGLGRASSPPSPSLLTGPRGPLRPSRPAIPGDRAHALKAGPRNASSSGLVELGASPWPRAEHDGKSWRRCTGPAPFFLQPIVRFEQSSARLSCVTGVSDHSPGHRISRGVSPSIRLCL